MIDDHQDTVRDGHHGFLLAETTSQTMILSREVVAGGMANGPHHFGQDRAQVGIPFPGLATESFAAALLVARADAGPRGQVLGTGRAGGVDPNLGQDRCGGGGLDPRYPLNQHHRFLKGKEPLFKFLLNLGQRFLQEINVGQDLLEQEPMVWLDASVQRLSQLW